ncbi:hypothetical protein, variant 2 [Exophiala oligosperma]|uniref:U1-type domain-containing protein n=1 Tax=Exophiala oligosperma TaxID=215243 RepID=A0A0D2D4F1_9EURO|nr:uncharacterized protein PV06_10070 [Exophiala oligosperma]XP_016258324.1 hypothetical protein, variant 1 [Exophiala oligosperma]XP_016258325.1 hypothetical protein, variant 2 [Exophiala oligosperma]KIW38107.1 hypothetical protein PV06_10070 [Exophiala oligosperma]KIW38108.1 hypothetical protein, variant 1 [Exophiala oligosperma]KIW38109.1 hypothetical protein, variant 2 [Exophiala oligosperma]
MAEYWKSTPKYWCKHCSVYVKDTPFERRQHEATARHENNLKRFLRDIQNSHEKGEREKERAKSEVERLAKIGGGTAQQASSLSSGTAAKPSSAASVRKQAAAPTAADQKRQWAQLAEMGIQVPENYRAEMAMAGDWTVVSQKSVTESPLEERLSTGVKRRKFEGQEEQEEAGETVARRGWGSTTRQYPGKDTTDLDDLLSATVPLKKEEAVSPSLEEKKPKDEDGLKQEDKAASGQESDNNSKRTSTKQEGPNYPDGTTENPRVKNEISDEQTDRSLDKIPEATPIPVFKKKRKAKAS